jgi:hypothetical protein
VRINGKPRHRYIKYIGSRDKLIESLLKVLDFLIDNEAFDHSKTDIAKGAGISRATLFNKCNIGFLCVTIWKRDIGEGRKIRGKNLHENHVYLIHASNAHLSTLCLLPHLIISCNNYAIAPLKPFPNP